MKIYTAVTLALLLAIIGCGAPTTAPDIDEPVNLLSTIYADYPDIDTIIAEVNGQIGFIGPPPTLDIIMRQATYASCMYTVYIPFPAERIGTSMVTAELRDWAVDTITEHSWPPDYYCGARPKLWNYFYMLDNALPVPFSGYYMYLLETYGDGFYSTGGIDVPDTRDDDECAKLVKLGCD